MTMRILVISDSHGNTARLKHTLGFAEKSGVGAIIHCGDWDTPEAIDVFKGSEINVHGVLGNADINPIFFNPSFLKLELGGRKIGVCHFLGKAKEMARSGEFDIVFHGHFHRRKEEVVGNTAVVNPGALTGLKPSCAVYDTDKNTVEFIDVAV